MKHSYLNMKDMAEKVLRKHFALPTCQMRKHWRGAARGARQAGEERRQADDGGEALAPAARGTGDGGRAARGTARQGSPPTRPITWLRGSPPEPAAAAGEDWQGAQPARL